MCVCRSIYTYMYVILVKSRDHEFEREQVGLDGGVWREGREGENDTYYINFKKEESSKPQSWSQGLAVGLGRCCGWKASSQGHSRTQSWNPFWKGLQCLKDGRALLCSPRKVKHFEKWWERSVKKDRPLIDPFLTQDRLPPQQSYQKITDPVECQGFSHVTTAA